MCLREAALSEAAASLIGGVENKHQLSLHGVALETSKQADGAPMFIGLGRMQPLKVLGAGVGC